MTTETPLVPDGISHALDLSRLPPAERMKQHRTRLHSIAFHQGLDGVAEYKRTHPEAAPVRVRVDALAYQPKPKGYLDAIGSIVAGWLSDDDAVGRSNRVDVSALNAALGTDRFNPANHFSKPLASREKKRIADLFASRGLHLPATARTLSDVRRAVKAAKAGARVDASSFGNVATRTGDTLTIGLCSYRIQRQGARECIRPIIGGTKRRLYLDELEWMANMLGGAGTGSNPLTNSNRVIGEPDQLAIPASAVHPANIAQTKSPGEPDQTAADPPSLRDRIAKLRAAFAPQALDSASPDIDPLEL